ncbi:MAG: hypothetical protein JRD89_00260 [Deltaproteobacteria bacterium]|nr:hypothetical protein [Deltaproteobacteria bacterium]
MIRVTENLYWGAIAPREEGLAIEPKQLDLLIYCGDCEEFAQYASEELRDEIDRWNVPVICLGWHDNPGMPPTRKSITFLVDTVNMMLRAGRSVCIACALGINRSFFALMCCLARTEPEFEARISALSRLRGINYEDWFHRYAIWRTVWETSKDKARDISDVKKGRMQAPQSSQKERLK